MSRKRIATKNILISAIAQIVVLLSNFIIRKIFVSTLSVEYLGLNGLFSNIVSLLSLAELGVGSAILFSLYLPLAEEEWGKIQAIMLLFKKIYISIGIVIFLLGMTVVPILPHLIKDNPIARKDLSIFYLLFLFNTASSYFFSYKRALIIADQKKYIDVINTLLFKVVLSITQIAFLLTARSFFLFLINQLLFAVLENISISWVVTKKYPDVYKSSYNESLPKAQLQSIKKNTLALFFHKIGGSIVDGTDNLLMSKLVGIAEVGLYSNYFMIRKAIQVLLDFIYQAIIPTLGNYNVTASLKQKRATFNNFNYLVAVISSVCSITLFNSYNTFIVVWLGPAFLLSPGVVLFIVINFYLYSMRQSVLMFRASMGIYWEDRYKPIIEALINIVASIILGKQYGIMGILLGTTISTFFACTWVEPYYLFKVAYEGNMKEYSVNFSKHTFLTILLGFVTHRICRLVVAESFFSFVLQVIISLGLGVLGFGIVFHKSPEQCYWISLLKSLIASKHSKV